MRILIKNGLVHQFSGKQSEFKNADLLVEGNRIAAIGKVEETAVDQIIDASGCLVLPGLINAHIHTYCHYVKGCFDNLPLDLWMLETRPFFSGKKETPEDVYARTLFSCIELLKNGTTMVMDDLSVSPALDGALYDAAMSAYRDAGIRADVAVDVVNRPPYDCLPYLKEEMPESMKTRLDTSVLTDETKILTYMEEKILKYNTADGLQRCILAPSAPQRCTVSLMRGIRGLSEKYHIPVVTHLLETPVQDKLGYLFYGKSLVKWMDEMELLYPNLNLMHTVWVEDEDMALIAAHGCKTVHNPGSNLKLGSGIAPVEKLLEAGISVGLGTDNTSCSDTLNLFEQMKLAALLHKIGTTDYKNWTGAQEAVRMGTYEGAVCAGKEQELGSLEPGKKADLIILDTENERFTPENNYVNQLVFCENGRSVRDVMIDGRLVVEAGRIRTFQEKEALRNFRQIVKRDMDWQKDLAAKEAKEVFPVYEKVYFKTLASGKGR